MGHYNVYPQRGTQDTRKQHRTASQHATASNDDDLASVILTWFIQVTGLAAAITFGVFSVLSWSTAQDAKRQANTAIEQANYQANNAYSQANSANQQAAAANLIALAALCAENVNNVFVSLLGRIGCLLICLQGTTFAADLQDFCGQLFPQAWTQLAQAVNNITPDITNITAPGSPSTSIPGPSSSFPPPVGGGNSEGASAGLDTPGQILALALGLTIGFVTFFVTALTWLRRWRKAQMRIEDTNHDVDNNDPDVYESRTFQGERTGIKPEASRPIAIDQVEVSRK